MDYTEEDFKNDRKLIDYVIRRYFKAYPDIYEDLISVGYFAMFKAVKAYDETKGSSMANFKITICKHEMSMLLREVYQVNKIKNELNTQKVSLTKILSNTEDILFADTIIDENFCITKNLDYENLVALCRETIKEVSKEDKLKRDILNTYLRTFNQTQTSKENNVSKQYVNMCVFKFREKLKIKLQKEWTA